MKKRMTSTVTRTSEASTWISSVSCRKKRNKRPRLDKWP